MRSLDRLKTRCEQLNEIPSTLVLKYSQQWFPVVEEFCLSAAEYPGVVVNEIRIGNWEERVAFEKILQHATMIAADDLGLSRGALEGCMGHTHFRLFESMCERLGFVSGAQLLLLPETIQLCKNIRNLFGTVTGGVAVFSVIESYAHKIFEHQLPLFLAAKRDGVKVYNESELDYITLHLKIEDEHAAESKILVDLLLKSGTKSKSLEKHIGILTTHFDDYWTAIERHILE